MSASNHRRCFFAIFLGISVALVPSPRVSANDEEQVAVRSGLEKKFDATFFGNKTDLSIEATQIRLTRLLKKRIATIDRACGLTEAQIRKLELAGRGAIKQLVEGIAEQKARFLAEERDDLAASRFLYESPEILATRKKIRTGPFDEDSLFEKTLKTVLTPDQATQFAQRPTRAAASNKTITAANANDLVRTAQLQKDVYRITWNPDGKQVALLQYNKPVDVVIPPVDQPVRTFGKEVVAFDYGQDANVVAIADNSDSVTIFDLSNGKERKISTGQRHLNVKFSPDGKTLVTASYSGPQAKLWSPSTGELLKEFDVGRHEGYLTPVFSPDGTLLAVGNRNSTTRLFNVATGKLLHTLDKLMSHELKFDPDGRTLAVVYVDG